jgi:hypothetical protein
MYGKKIIIRPGFCFKLHYFLFELFNFFLFEMEFLKMAHFIFLAMFHLKMILCQNFNLPHTYGHYFEKKNSFLIWWLSNFSHGSQTYYNFKFITTWIQTWRWLPRRYNCWHLLIFPMNKRLPIEAMEWV